MSCPICRKPTEAKFRPFCSKRCADIDLGRWMGGDYAIPSTDPEDMEKAAEAFEQWLNDPEAQKDKPH
ncbi:DNA gyrase inhibitor YacG [Thetidibacter halocola]|uniref:DNA gyrase inhibitor YacG n=1 Tax=Thetidibacter halocola TaxID=2827239 RepID=A0A8J7WCY2_9RHOB|nr:DNA gyrase inhibitor YacG [Thetidibacter halocola]MBS0123086.1 DNA gyrase inhibitor YacG [Thetidibacter halocola]